MRRLPYSATMHVSLVLAALLIPAGVHAQSRVFDHSAFDRLLKAHVSPAGMVDYDAFERAPGFTRYLGSLARVDPRSLPEAERLALWINAYNAYTIALINQHEERRSIRNINKTLGFIKGKGPWGEPLARVGGRDYTLDQIEHEIIRKEFREPRIHFALVCAAVGCPPLRREAYSGDRLDAQLDDQARAFLLRSPAKNRLDVGAKRVYLSPIFDWYGQDFGQTDAAIGRYLARFYPAGPMRQLLLGDDFKIVYTAYDWSLNRQE
ncbi:MAG: DUF547 domain-containing protein [Gemmatimonadota bacterium]|nr:DUF547 domain-containing protein [Gemmatimonadota bacterium]